MSHVIRVDEEVWEWLRRNASPLVDTPNSVLRRIANLDRVDSDLSAPTVSAPAIGPTEDRLTRYIAGDLTTAPRRSSRHSSMKLFLGEMELEAKRMGARITREVGRASLIEVQRSNRRTLLYVKRSDYGGDGFWGLSKNVIQELRSSKTAWMVVLLAGGSGKMYAAPAASVEHEISTQRWSQGAPNDYKLHETSNDLTAFSSFGQDRKGITALLERCLGASAPRL